MPSPSLTAAECSRMRLVRARRAIRDTPLAVGAVHVLAGTIGEVCDVDDCVWPEPIVFVDFGAGAIACTADELGCA